MKSDAVSRMPRFRHLFVTWPSEANAMRESPQPMAPRAFGITPCGLAIVARLDDTVLIKLVLEAVHEFDSGVPVFPAGRSGAINPAQTATLLGYCYARGILSAEEIEARLPHDQAIAYICAGKKPDWHMLRRFRRDNTLLLLGILTRLLELAAFQTGASSSSSLPEHWRIAFREEALNRLRDAIHADSLAMDQ